MPAVMRKASVTPMMIGNMARLDFFVTVLTGAAFVVFFCGLLSLKMIFGFSRSFTSCPSISSALW